MAWEVRCKYFYAYSAANVATTLWSSTTNAARDGSTTDTPGFTSTPTLSLSGLPATASCAFTNVSASGATLVIFAQQSAAP